MSIVQHVYAEASPIYFKLTSSGAGVNPTLEAGDVKISKDGNTAVNVTNLPDPVDATNMTGVFEWTPTSLEATCKVMVINFKEVTGTVFDENCLIISTGGHASARFSG